MRKVAFPLFLAVLILALVSCPSPNRAGSAGGSLVITLPQTALQDAKNPDLTVPSSYDALGAGPGNAGFQKLGITGTSVTIDSLAPGDWGVTVNGNNINGMQVVSASIQATIAAGQTASAKAVMNTSTEQGSFDVTMTWPAGSAVLSPRVSLTPQAGSPIVISLAGTVSGSSFSAHQTSPAAAGYYTASISYLDGKDFTWGGAEAVYVASGKTTSLVFTPFDAVKMTINPDISKALPIVMSSLKSNFGQGEDVTVSAAPTQLTSFKSTSYQWYLNGTVQSQAASIITFPRKTLAGGDYRLDVVVGTQSVLASNHVLFTVAGN